MKKIKIITAIIAAAAVITAAAFMISPQLRFTAQAVISSLDKGENLKEITASKSDFVTAELSELKYGKNCVFDQSLILVNKEHPLPADFEPELIRYENTEANLNFAACSAFIQMRDHISERFDSRLLIMSAYRSRDKQLEIYNEDNDGTAAKPGESEHETGLGIDVYVKYFAGKGFLKSDVGKYVNKNCGKFGFIIRYPLGKKHITGFDYEPWHIRYVGLPHSQIISDCSLTLEEYIESIEIDCFYQYGDYIISKQDGDEIIIPSKYESLTVSPDNLGNLIITAKIR